MKKQLQLLQSELNKSYQELLKIEINRIIIYSEFSFISNLELKDKHRSCKVYPFGNEQSPEYVFEWDECPIFEISSADINRQGEIIINWVIEKSMPSIMQTQFPEIKLNDLAKYYENGEGVKGEFIESWNILEKNYNHELSIEPNEYCKNAIRLIKEMRNLKLDESLRAGTQLFVFILSRARRHIVNESRPHITIVFLENNRMKINSNLNDEKKNIITEVKYKGHLEEIVKKLLKEKIK